MSDELWFFIGEQKPFSGGFQQQAVMVMAEVGPDGVIRLSDEEAAKLKEQLELIL